MKKIICAIIVVANVFVISTPIRAATYTVTNSNDSGAGSLRQAVTDANAAGGSHTIASSGGGNGATIPGSMDFFSAENSRS